MQDSAQRIYGSPDLTGWTVITSEDDFTETIYNSIKSCYSMNTLLISSFDVLHPEEYYVNLMPTLSGLEFYNVIIYNNVIYLQCAYTYDNNSFIGEEIAVEYALVNGTDYLSSSELELYNKVMELALSLKTTGDNSEYDTVKNIHDYLVRSIAYTYQADMDTPDDDRSAQRLRSALFLHKCVCAGYAKSFYFLCKAAGLDVVYVTGDATNSKGTQSHAWNKVKIGGKWYAIDVTWDDPLVYDPNTGTSHDGGDTVEYTYFLITDADMAINHTWDDTGLPVAESDDLAPIYLQYADIPKFTSDDAAYDYILAQLNAYKAQNNPSQSGFDFEITVLSTDGSTLYSKISQLANEYRSTYGCGASRGYSSAGFYGLEFTLQIYK